MTPYPRHVPVDLAKYHPGANVTETLFGLPADVAFCTNCVISNQRPNSVVEIRHTRDSRKATIQMHEDGVCDACKVTKAKSAIDWDARRAELVALCDKYRRNDGHYDCLMSGSGGKDSFYASHVIKHEFGMHPLTVTWAPHLYTDWGWQNFQSWIHAGFDNWLHTPNGRVHRLVTRLAVENLFHPFQPFIIGQKNVAPKLAAKFGIPLVFYGESEAEYGNPQADATSAQRSWDYFTAGDKSQVYLGGVSIESLYSDFGLEPVDLEPYMPANPAELQENGVQVHYLGYYTKWHPQSAYYYAVEEGGFQASPERTAGTFSKYSSIDDKIDDFHYWTTFIKFGIGRATYDAAQDVRSGDIERPEAVALVRRFDGEYPERFAEEIYRYLSLPAREFPVASRMFEQPILDRDYMLHLADRFRSPHLWTFEGGQWKQRHTVYEREAVTT